MLIRFALVLFFAWALSQATVGAAAAKMGRCRRKRAEPQLDIAAG